jgi:acyl dehydratase
MAESSTTDQEFRAKLDAFIGKPMGADSATAPDPVNIPMIRHWVDALEDENPVYLDEEIAATTRFGGVVAPPAMLQSWTMGRPRIQGLAKRGGAPAAYQENVLTLLDEAGYRATRATNSELEFERYLEPGDLLESSTLLEAISDEKKTALGNGFFVTWVVTYKDQQNEVVGRQRFRVLKFKPDASLASSPAEAG